ncbi:MAG: hypothetical protein EHM35_01155 [Planctomycetaceae bacterium]|nr:MAG: hypothetical protein EHM35_21440 [Planctomycetaceae bacterium]RPJ39871.1 MAG: hypothetical protein EHM35_01155 [Planctomycetaceae bacterium]
MKNSDTFAVAWTTLVIFVMVISVMAPTYLNMAVRALIAYVIWFVAILLAGGSHTGDQIVSMLMTPYSLGLYVGLLLFAVPAHTGRRLWKLWRHGTWKPSH